MPEKSGAEILIDALLEQGVDTVFGYPGGAVLPIYDALFQQKKIKHVLVRHEAGAAHAAEGYARSTGKPGVVLVTSGPGATNAVTGIADAFLDSIPLVVITGQVATNLIGTDAFQEADTVGITRHCSKHNYLVKDPEDLAATVREAFHDCHQRPARSGGDRHSQKCSGCYCATDIKSECAAAFQPAGEADYASINKAVEMLADAKAPILYTGGGIINSGPDASAALRELAESRARRLPPP